MREAGEAESECGEAKGLLLPVLALKMGGGHPPGYEGKGSFSKLKIARNLILSEPAERNTALLTP